jgi:hypothetical protein
MEDSWSNITDDFKILYSIHFWLQNVHNAPTKYTVFIPVFKT